MANIAAASSTRSSRTGSDRAPAKPVSAGIAPDLFRQPRSAVGEAAEFLNNFAGAGDET